MSAIIINCADHGSTLTLQLGQHLMIQLGENPTTGYRWNWVHENEEIVLLKDSIYIPPTPGLKGLGGQHNFHFEASKIGVTSLDFKLWRSWEGDSSTQQRFNIMLIVRP